MWGIPSEIQASYQIIFPVETLQHSWLLKDRWRSFSVDLSSFSFFPKIFYQDGMGR